MRISDWSSDVCSSDLQVVGADEEWLDRAEDLGEANEPVGRHRLPADRDHLVAPEQVQQPTPGLLADRLRTVEAFDLGIEARSEEHPSELQSLMRTSYAVFCLTNKTSSNSDHHHHHTPMPTKTT